MEETYHKLATDGHEYSDIRKESKEVGGKNKFSEIFPLIDRKRKSDY